MDIMVSILCTAYNQEDYIAEALESFIRQKTKFNFEVIVHDDASTDNTAQIIKKYQEKYPNIIVPIYQSENQFSKGIKITKDILMKVARGKYFALCEGDDFWVDDYKLQKQVDYMELHSKCSMCVHNGILVDRLSNKIGDYTICSENRIADENEIIRIGGSFCPTNSILSRMCLVKNLPNYFKFLTMDVVWEMYLGSVGYVYCMNDVMSAYRVNAKNSWSEKMSKSGNDKKIKHLEKIIQFKNMFDEETGYKYHKSIDIVIREDLIYKYILEENYEAFKNFNFKDLYSDRGFRGKIKIFLLKHFSFLFKIINNMRNNH